MERVIRRSCELAFFQLNTAVSLSCYLLLKHGEYDQLATRQVDPRDYLDTISGVVKYARDVQAVDLLRKAPLVTTFSRRENAERAFHEAEAQCYRTNSFIRLTREYPCGALESALHRVVERGKRWIGRVFGALPDDLPFGFGPGTTFELEKSTFSTLGDKITTVHAVTGEAYSLAEFAWSGTSPARVRIHRGLPLHSIVRGNRFATVPKDGKTDRGICIEPGGNLYLQKGVGSYLKERLGSVGIYVWDSPKCKPTEWRPSRPSAESIHRRLARDGSRGGGWATIDLSSASDTLSSELVRWILPPDWFDLLNSMRSRFTRMKTSSGVSWHRLEKFSSMGNGFTFELETAVFCALVHGVTGLIPGRDFFVYGDDIVVPERVAEDCVAVLKATGFTPNPRKTFLTGFFRESCGGDYFLGFNVRPFQVKTLEVELDNLRALHNGFVRCGLLLAAKHVASCIPRTYRSFGPARLGDSVLHGARSAWQITTRDSIEWIKTHSVNRFKIPIDRWGDDAVVHLMLLGVDSSGLVPRGASAVGTRIDYLSVS